MLCVVQFARQEECHSLLKCIILYNFLVMLGLARAASWLESIGNMAGKLHSIKPE